MLDLRFFSQKVYEFYISAYINTENPFLPEKFRTVFCIVILLILNFLLCVEDTQFSVVLSVSDFLLLTLCTLGFTNYRSYFTILILGGVLC